MSSPRALQIAQDDPAVILAELLAGLLGPIASVSPKYLCDVLGSRLFSAITELPEYYPTRTEAAIFAEHQGAMAAALGPVATLVDLGADNCEKAARLFAALCVRRYVAVDTSVRHLRESLGVTAALNRNRLLHLNRLIGANFDVADWRHVAFFNAAESRIEMHLEALRGTTVRWAGGERQFAAAERMHTESSYKWRIEDFAALREAAGFRAPRHWCDARGWFAVFAAHA